ncbi:hypothetical protein [Austwickia chelonae]|uniref:hypothetical protein n=1 Tax=Austwickia chelonae TaxID=100225 RepID=UPI0013C34544|nr:hypothetical protein [Austwickia chelonae]
MTPSDVLPHSSGHSAPDFSPGHRIADVLGDLPVDVGRQTEQRAVRDALAALVGLALALEGSVDAG